MIFHKIEEFLLLFLVPVFFFLWYLFRRYISSVKKHEWEGSRKLREAQSQLQDYMADLDNLITMLVSIHEFGTAATGIISKDELAQSIVNSVCRLLKTDAVSLMFNSRETNELVVIASVGVNHDIVSSAKIKLGEGIAGRVAQTGKPIFVENIDTDIRFQKHTSLSHPSKSFISVPLRIKERITGVISVSSSQPDKKFEERDMRLLTVFADQAAITLENIELYSNLQNFYLEMVQTLARAIDSKDSYTHDHSDRAKHFARLIATKLGLPEIMIRHIEYAALMHDIGKIGINDNILNKAGRLTDEEREIIKKHPAIGNRILAPVAFLAPVAPMVLYHQEWFNGQGYPEGLAGEEIPLGARIVAVIDAYDAMTTDRPYRKALSVDIAVSELKKGSGTQFDPKIVYIFLEILIEENKDKEGKKQDL